MIEQLPIYLLCYFLGWVPLYFLYRKIELWLPFNLKKASVIFSWLPFSYGLYMIAEIARGYALMYIVHQWLSFDIDLIIGTILWFVAIGFPPFVSSSYRTSIWLSVMGVYFYLFPLYVWLVPMVLILAFFIGQSRLIAYGFIGAAFLLIGFFTGSNSLYLMLYISLLFYLVFKSYLDAKSTTLY